MNILVMSDSHGNYGVVKDLLDTYKSQVQMVLHLGDNSSDLLRFMKDYPNLQMHAVDGNCDGGVTKEQIISVEGRRILMVHGHTHGVKINFDRLAYYAEEKGVDICLFGHTHSHDEFYRRVADKPIYFFNPGSVNNPREGRPSYGLLRLDEGITGKAVYL